jgi:diguanylate cyclase (GGDEF)-like protein
MEDHREKPVILVVDDEKGCLEARARFAEKEQLIYTASNMRGVYEVFHDKDELGQVSVLINPRNVLSRVIPDYINDALRHRAMIHVWTTNPDDPAIHDWGEKHRAHSYFRKGEVLPDGTTAVGTPVDIIVREVINSPTWEWILTHFKDSLTGFDNFKGFLHTVIPQLEAMRDDRSGIIYASILVIDGDGVKHINDTFGHPAGTQAILAYANALKEFLRRSDHPCRYGGDEFVLFLPGRGRIPALSLGEKVTHKISATDFSPAEGKKLALSASWGVVEFHQSDLKNWEGTAEAFLEKVIKAADEEMYKEKEKKKRGRAV